MIRAGEKPHTGGVTQLKRVALAKSTPGATSTSPPARLAQRGDRTELLHVGDSWGLLGSPCCSATSHTARLSSCTSPCLPCLWGVASVAWVPVHPEDADSC